MSRSPGLSLCVLLALATAGAASAEERYLLLPVAAPAITRQLSPQHVVYTEGAATVLRVQPSDIDALATVVHHSLGGCGGFIDVTDEILAGHAPELLVWTETLRSQLPAPKFPIPVLRGRTEVGDLVSHADGDRLWEFLTELSAMPDRSATTDNGGKAAEFLRTTALESATALPGLNAWKVETGTSSYKKQPSIVVTLPGTDPSLPGVVLGAHMDTFSPNKPGADDDGSGTAIVMETLRAAAAAEARFKHTIHFVWYSAEERGLVGSGYVVKRFEKDGLKVKAALQMDMVGLKSPQDDKDVYLITDYTSGDLTETLRRLIQLYTTASVGETRCGYPCSDHVNWHRAGIPAVFPFEATFENMNQRLHTGEDKIVHLDKDHSLNFARIALAFLGELADLEK